MIASPSLGLAPTVGVGLRAPHTANLLAGRSALEWLEIHSENYFSAGGPHLHALQKIRRDHAISAHGVGLSLGSAQALSERHLARLEHLVRWLEPVLVSEHLAWGALDGRCVNDLIPLPYTREALPRLSANIDRVQTRLQRQILIENVSSYVEFVDCEMPVSKFLAELATQSGCGILLDIHNIYINACNHGFDPVRYIEDIPPALVQQIHVAGHSVQTFEGIEIMVDTHNARVADSVWCLLRHAIRYMGPRPVLVEWDSDLPAFSVLLEEAALARECLGDPYAQAA